MKKESLFIFVFLFIFAFSGVAQNKNNGNIEVKGKIAIKKDSKILLFGAVDGMWQELANGDTDSEGNFSFTVPTGDCKIWAIAETPQNKFAQPYKARFYAKSGEKVEIYVDKNWADYNLGAKPSKQNIYLKEWSSIYDEIFPVFNRNTYKDLYPKIESFIAGANKFAEKIKTNDKVFNELMKFYVKTEALYGIINFRFMPNTIHPSKEEIHKIYREFGENFVFDSPLFKFLPFTSRLMGSLEMQYSSDNKDSAKGGDIDFEDYILNQRIKSNDLKAIYFMGNKMRRFRSYDDFENSYSQFKDYIYSDSQKKIIEDYVKENKRLSKGQPAFDFTYSDAAGKMVSLSDFKGKVVVVDVWATWCGPCREQIPHLQKLEHEFANNSDVVFIAVSTDQEKDKQKWLDMIKEQKMGGIQLLALPSKELMTNYKITGIPRFMVFDKNGNIVSASAPRPSDPKLKTMIEEELKK